MLDIFTVVCYNERITNKRDKMSRKRGGRRHRSSMSNCLKIGGTIAAIVAIVGALFITGAATTNSQCRAAGFKGSAGIDSCRVDEKYTYDKIALVVGNTANSPIPKLSNELTKYLKNSLLNNPEIKITIFSATPSRNKLHFDAVSINDDGNTKSLLSNIDEQILHIADAIQTEPEENGAEYFETIRRAAGSLQERGSKSIILVIGSGLSDSGPLNYAKGSLMSKTSNEIIAALRKAKAIDDENEYNSDLVWYGIGEVSKPQSVIPDNAISTIKSHYSDILGELGIEVSFDNSTSDSNESIKTKYIVKTTPIKENSAIFDKAFDDASKLGFNEGSAIFRQGADKAWSELKSSGLIAMLTSNPSLTVYINGYVAVECNKAADIALAQKRSDAVKKLLHDYGITNEIVAKGVGQTEISKQNGICIGKSSAGELQKQRVVIITVKE